MLIVRQYYSADFVPVLQAEGCDIVLSNGATVNLALSTDVYCLGYTQQGARHDCPKKATGKKQCATCAKEDDFLSCLRCDGATCLQFTPQWKEDCFGKDYTVYLASFGDKVKAGVTQTARVRKRWVEQGADYAVRVFSGLNGQQARVIESALVRSGYIGRHTTAEKLQLPTPVESAIQDELESDSIRRVTKLFQKNALEPKIESMQSHYPAITTAKSTDYLNGTVLGAKGPVLFLEQNGADRVFGLPNAVGRKVLTHTLSAFA
ncbi:DUF2797 domain-containing protein [Candidatus Micrarchaeota archaeon]|nr:DUF2797 domain-containing protein [Candidatus Micrarchaeota archaeon]